eukprot:7986147-Heterocapsa_arctica.AAC.1
MSQPHTPVVNNTTKNDTTMEQMVSVLWDNQNKTAPHSEGKWLAGLGIYVSGVLSCKAALCCQAVPVAT